MDKAIPLSSLETLADRYDCFIFDIYGVIYDGTSLINRTIDFIYHLRRKNKKITFLSNSQRIPELVREELRLRGFSAQKEEQIFTSGEYFRLFLRLNSEFKNKHVFYNLGNSNSIAKTLADIELTDDLKKSTCIILTFSTTDQNQINTCDIALKHAINNQCILVCFNPDITAPHGDKIMYTPGYFAKKFEQLGGKVMYFGKPYKEIYEFFIDKFLIKNGIAKQKAIAVGDSLSTDIKGAKTFGIDSLFLFSEQRKIQSSFNNQDSSIPTYIFQI
ncbi:MAG: TIGR01459 family HAD-type hydrolase [Rickettsiales bacterium]|nr:TIGR01459 family HAD-type hydrolase [Rickettsiales bacterium]